MDGDFILVSVIDKTWKTSKKIQDQKDITKLADNYRTIHQITAEYTLFLWTFQILTLVSHMSGLKFKNYDIME